MSDYENYRTGAVSRSADKFIEAWRRSKNDALNELVNISGFDSEDFDVEGMMKFTRLMAMISKFEDLTVTMCECMDAQIKEIEALQDSINAQKCEIKVIQDSIYELTNKVEEIIEKK